MQESVYTKKSRTVQKPYLNMRRNSKPPDVVTRLSKTMQTAQLRRTIASDAMPTVPIVYFAIATGLVWLMFLVMAAIRACTGDYNTPPPEAHLHATAATAPQRSEAEKVAMLATIDASSPAIVRVHMSHKDSTPERLVRMPRLCDNAGYASVAPVLSVPAQAFGVGSIQVYSCMRNTW